MKINLFFLISANILGMFGGYALEYYTRRDFFSRLLLKQESKKVEQANLHLEEKVVEKTKKLQDDILRRKQIEEELRESEEKYRKLIETLNEGIWRVDALGCTTFVNTRMAEMLECAPEKMQGRYIREFMNDDWLKDTRALAHKYSPHVTEQQEYIFEKKNGTVAHLLLNTSPLFDKQGRFAGALAGVVDITERKNAEEEHEKLQGQLTQAQKMESVGRLAGGVAHDFNNMLSVILGHADLVLADLPENHDLNIHLSEINKAAKRSADLTRQLLAFARRQTVEPKVLNLNDTIQDMLKMLGRLIGENIELLWKPGTGQLTVHMDPAQIDQLLANLVVNARDAIESVGQISIETSLTEFDEAQRETHAQAAPGQYVMLAVSDTGRGMDQETVSQIFEPFFTTKETGKGTGLGLSTVYGIIKQNQGMINVYSEPDKGSTFRIYLPLHVSDQEKQGDDEKENAAAASGNETILLVEDESAILNLGKNLLEKLGYCVLAASTPSDALRLAKDHDGEIHLLITDVVMPEMNGRDLAKELHYLYPDLSQLFMSGYTADVIAHHGVLEKGVHFLAKPFSLNNLAVKVREALGRKLAHAR